MSSVTCAWCVYSPLGLSLGKLRVEILAFPRLFASSKTERVTLAYVSKVLDDKNVRRRFRASNYQSTTRVKPFICTMPMRLDDGWNQIQFNLSDFTRRAYGTNYIETLRVQVPGPSPHGAPHGRGDTVCYWLVCCMTEQCGFLAQVPKLLSCGL